MSKLIEHLSNIPNLYLLIDENTDRRILPILEEYKANFEPLKKAEGFEALTANPLLVDITGKPQMLKTLVRHPRQPLSREKLAQLARGREFEPFDRSLDVQVSRLRKLIEVDAAVPRYIQTVWGVGYVFVPDGTN